MMIVRNLLYGGNPFYIVFLIKNVPTYSKRNLYNAIIK